MADITFSKPTYANGVNALSAATFQPLANAIDEIAHQANRTGILAADTVPGYGIGTVKTLTASTDLNTIVTNGFYAVATPTYTNNGVAYDAPTFGNHCVLKVEMDSAGYGRQELTNTQSALCYYRTMYNNAWYGWFTMWARFSDGNGGQPPAAKPNVTANAAGEWLACTQYVGGAAGDTGTWAFIQFTAAGAYSTCGIANGGVDKGAGVLMMCWKLTT
jgi:hypothetical protein